MAPPLSITDRIKSFPGIIILYKTSKDALYKLQSPQHPAPTKPSSTINQPSSASTHPTQNFYQSSPITGFFSLPCHHIPRHRPFQHLSLLPSLHQIRPSTRREVVVWIVFRPCPLLAVRPATYQGPEDGSENVRHCELSSRPGVEYVLQVVGFAIDRGDNWIGGQ